MNNSFKDWQYYKFCFYGFLKNLKFFEPFFILFLLGKNLNFTQIAVLYSIREIIVYLSEIPTGIIADALGRKRTLIFSFGFYIISFLLFYFSTNLFILVFAMIFFAFGDSFRTGTHKAMIFEYLKIKQLEDKKVIYYGGTRSCSQVGSAISAILAAFLVFVSKNYNTIFLFSIIPYLFDMLLIISYPKELDGKKGALNFSHFKKEVTEILSNLWQDIKQAHKFSILINVSSFSAYFKQSKDYLQVIIQTFAITYPIIKGVTEKQQVAIFIGISFFIIYLLTSRASKNSSRINNLFPNKRNCINWLLSIGLLGGMLGGLLYHYHWFLLAVLFFVVIYLIENMRKPIGISLIAEEFNAESLATSLSVESLTKTLLASLIALLMGILADIVGLGYALSLVSVIILLLASFFFFKPKKKR